MILTMRSSSYGSVIGSDGAGIRATGGAVTNEAMRLGAETRSVSGRFETRRRQCRDGMTTDPASTGMMKGTGACDRRDCGTGACGISAADAVGVAPIGVVAWSASGDVAATGSATSFCNASYDGTGSHSGNTRHASSAIGTRLRSAKNSFNQDGRSGRRYAVERSVVGARRVRRAVGVRRRGMCGTR